MISKNTKLIMIVIAVMSIMLMTACGKTSTASSEAETSTELQTVNSTEASTVQEAATAASAAIVSENSGKMRIINVDKEEKRLPGSTFEIKDSNGNVVATKVADSDGLVELSNINADEYIITEVAAPDGYIWEDKPQTLQVNSNHTSTITFVNVQQTGTIKLIMLDEDGGFLENMEFAILDSDKNQIGETIVTDADGVAYKENLPVGRYYIREISAPLTVLKDYEDHEVELKNANETFTCTGTNYYVRGKFHVKVSGEDGAAVSGAQYNIYDASDNWITTVVTDENGEGSTDYLKNGKYYVQEASLPDNKYQLDTQTHEFTMEYEDTTYSYNKYLSVGWIQIIVKDKSGNPVAGIKYEVRRDDNEQLVDTIITDASGTATSKELPLGNYYYKEIEVPDYVAKDSVEYVIELDKANYTMINRITK